MTSNNQYIEYLRYKNINKVNKLALLPEMSDPHILALDDTYGPRLVYVWKLVPQKIGSNWYWKTVHPHGPYSSEEEARKIHGNIPNLFKDKEASTITPIHPYKLYLMGLHDMEPEEAEKYTNIDWRPPETIDEDQYL